MAVFRRRGVQCLVGVGVLAAAAVMVPGLAQAAGEVPRYVAVAGSDTVGGDCTLAAQPCATVQHALAVAGTGDIVLVAAGTYHEALASTYGTALAVSVQGGWDAGWQGQSGVTTMDATGRTSPAGTGEVLRLRNAADDVSLDHVTLTGGQGLGGAITVQGGTLHLTRSVLTGNRASSGGAINSSGTVTVTDSTLSNNTAADAAGGIDNSGTLTLASSTVADNAVDPTRFDGGALRNTGTATITGSTLRGNSARESIYGDLAQCGA